MALQLGANLSQMLVFSVIPVQACPAGAGYTDMELASHSIEKYPVPPKMASRNGLPGRDARTPGPIG